MASEEPQRCSPWDSRSLDELGHERSRDFATATQLLNEATRQTVDHNIDRIEAG